MDWRGRTGQIVNLFRDKINGDLISDVSIHEFEVGMIDNVLDISQVACHKVINADNFMSFFDKAIAKMRSNESTASSD